MVGVVFRKYRQVVDNIGYLYQFCGSDVFIAGRYRDHYGAQRVLGGEGWCI
jgi:hypothetical protein